MATLNQQFNDMPGLDQIVDGGCLTAAGWVAIFQWQYNLLVSVCDQIGGGSQLENFATLLDSFGDQLTALASTLDDKCTEIDELKEQVADLIERVIELEDA